MPGDDDVIYVSPVTYAPRDRDSPKPTQSLIDNGINDSVINTVDENARWG